MITKIKLYTDIDIITLYSNSNFKVYVISRRTVYNDYKTPVCKR